MIIKNTNTAVVILNWNGLNWLQQFIPTLVKNTPVSMADIIIADNGSTDDSFAFINQNFPAIQWLQLDKNYGFAEGYNRAIEAITHPFCILLNSDVEVTPNWIEPLVKALDSEENTAACQPKIMDFKRKDYFEYAGAAGGFIDYLAYPFCRGRLFETLEKDHGQYNDTAELFWASGACLAIKTEWYKAVGGLDGEFFAHMEEIDLCWRLKSRGLSIKFVPDSTVYHVGGGTLSKISPKKTYLNFRNNLLILYKNLPKSQLIQILFLRLILDGVAGLKMLLSGDVKHTFAILKAHFHFYNMFRSFKHKRKNNLEKTIVSNIPQIFSKTLIICYFIKGKRKFSDLIFKS